jgi:hypothetical protein
MFESEKLWTKGFTGAKVRMAVFDTGVRADHPHFRNIKVHQVHTIAVPLLCFKMLLRLSSQCFAELTCVCIEWTGQFLVSPPVEFVMP